VAQEEEAVDEAGEAEAGFFGAGDVPWERSLAVEGQGGQRLRGPYPRHLPRLSGGLQILQTTMRP